MLLMLLIHGCSRMGGGGNKPINGGTKIKKREGVDGRHDGIAKSSFKVRLTDGHSMVSCLLFMSCRIGWARMGVWPLGVGTGGTALHSHAHANPTHCIFLHSCGD